MRSTQDAAGVGTDAIAETIVDKMLSTREVLPHAANGQPKAPSNPRAAQIRKDMRQGSSREWLRLLTVAECDLADGVPVEMVEAPLLMALAHLRQLARVRTDRPLPVLMRQETKAQATLDLAQLKLAESPECADALAAVLAEADRYATPLEELRATCREKLAVIRSKPARAAGARRGHIQLHA